MTELTKSEIAAVQGGVRGRGIGIGGGMQTMVLVIAEFVHLAGEAFSKLDELISPILEKLPVIVRDCYIKAREFLNSPIITIPKTVLYSYAACITMMQLRGLVFGR